MRESVQRRRGPWRFNVTNHQDNTVQTISDGAGTSHLLVIGQISRFGITLLTAVLLIPSVAFAQSPWERAATNLEQTFTGPLARSLALVAIVIGGLMFMFGEAGAKRQISGIVFGGGLALFAAQFLTWLF